jgi:hypothetical protein
VVFYSEQVLTESADRNCVLHRIRVGEKDLASSRSGVWDPELCSFDDVDDVRLIVQSCSIAKWSV